jgi:hypothetical protein
MMRFEPHLGRPDSRKRLSFPRGSPLSARFSTPIDVPNSARAAA